MLLVEVVLFLLWLMPVVRPADGGWLLAVICSDVLTSLVIVVLAAVW